MNVAEALKYFNHLSTFELISYQIALREMPLSAIKVQPTTFSDEKAIIRGPVHTKVWDTKRGHGHMTQGTHLTAINHHIAVNLVLRNRGITD